MTSHSLPLPLPLPLTPVNYFPATITITTYPPTHIHKPPPITITSSFKPSTPQFHTFSASSSNGDYTESQQLEPEPEPEPELESEPETGDASGIEVEIEKVSSNRRVIRSKVLIEASLETVWGILTDYERLADVIPSLVVSQVLDKSENFARLLQIGQQNLAFGLKFSAKGVVDCYEQDFEVLPYGQRRNIEFKMIEGDFQLFEGKWSIEQYEQSGFESGQQYNTTLLYMVEVEPKMWLPVQLVEGRISREIQVNLFSIREEARRISDSISSG
ncbi:uncharacterized protein LOC143577784 [Bidens hawaiensis]|uniref:uncharacterized protein LOC143577784 n=1 Tax=Bidens hawaiensis TaxID=980011 RepID=UPI00404A6C90